MSRITTLVPLVLLSTVWTTSAVAQGLLYKLGDEASSNADFGRSVGDAGDIDHDGYPDVIVGAPFHNPGSGTRGAVFIYSGRTGGLLWTRSGEYLGDAFGWSVDGIGDVNGDGASDVIVSAPLFDNNGAGASGGGKAYVFSPATNSTIWTLYSNGLNVQMGRVVRGLGDIDGDSVGDFVVTSDSFDQAGLIDCGAVFAFSGASQAGLWTRFGSEFGEHFGYSLDVLRATGAQGTSRLIVGSPQYDAGGSDRGRVTILNGFGGTVSFLNGTTNDTWFGYAVAGLGDVNSDGFSDYAASMPYANVLFVGSQAGLARIYSGATDTPLITFTGQAAGARLGEALSGFGDMNGDGVPDLLIGSPAYAAGGIAGSGQVLVGSGSNGATLATFSGGFNDNFGRSVSSAGDLNLDGTPDFIFGAPEAPHGAGEARVHLSQWSAPVTYCTAKVNSQGCTPSIAYAGAASASIANSFHVTASDVINLQPGILIWSRGVASTPFMGGTLCIAGPIIRTTPQTAGGSAGAPDCSGSYDFHFSHFYMATHGIFPGDRIYTQYWSRDPGSSFGIGLTNALRFDVAP